MRERGLDRFEVRGLEADKALLRAAAKRLAQGDARSRELRARIEAGLEAQADRRGGILAALRRSPLVGADLVLERDAGLGRDLDL
jgi:hypothetical protein